MGSVGIIHMGGRIYYPTLGRFLQADPHIQAPNNSQNYNRYSYVLNNPMSYTDPSGFFFKSLFKALAKVPILNTAVQIGIGIACGPAAAACMAAYSAAQTYALTGSVSGALKAGAISYATSTAFKAVGGKYTGKGGFFDAGVKNGFRHIVSHAMVGGVSSVLQGGKFGHGFFSAGITKGLTPHFEGLGGSDFEVNGYNVAEATIAGILGGTISKATGGKFANGAVTAAMGNLFNNQLGRMKRAAELREARRQALLTGAQDGHITLAEANAWRADGTGNPLTADLSRVDLSKVSSSEFPNGIGSTESIDLFLRSNDGNVYGHISLTLISATEVVANTPDVYDFFYGRSNQSVRNVLANGANYVGEVYADSYSVSGKTPSDFSINFVGVGTITP